MLHLCLQTSTAIAVLTTHPMVCLSAARRARELSSLPACHESQREQVRRGGVGVASLASQNKPLAQHTIPQPRLCRWRASIRA